MQAVWWTSQILKPGRLLLGLMICVSPAWGQQSGTIPKLQEIGYVYSGWGPILTSNQLIQHLMQRDEESRRQVPRREWSPDRFAKLKLTRDALRRVKNGVGIDYRIGQRGGLHFNLYRRSRIKGEGVRYAFNANSADQNSTQAWTLGGSMQQIRTEDGDRFIRFVPQLIVNPDGCHDKMRRWRFQLEYGYWFGGDKRAAAAERVLQANVALRF